MADEAESGNPCKKIKLDKDVDDNEDVKSADVKPGELTTQSTNAKDEENIAGDVEPVTNDAKEVEITKDVDTSLAVHANDDAPKDGGGDPESDSDVSVISNMSGLSGEASWRGSSAGPMAWVYRSMEEGVDPRTILRQVIPDDSMIPDVDNLTLWKIVISIVSEPAPREKLTSINTLTDVIRLMKECKKIMVLTGAGVSVSCGIPDFRSRNGVYARLAVDFPDLPDPQSMFDIRYFRRDQRPFFKFAKEIYPGQFEPSKCHKFIRMIEDHGKLLRNYTQNIDTLEQVAGIKNIIQCHGSFASATCMVCSHKCTGDDIKAQIMDQVIPMCSKCEPQSSLSVMKPDIVFFGESLPEEFHDQMTVDKDDCDLLVVIGSSLKVRPVALIPNSLPPHIPQILINKEPLRNMNFDVELLGDCDTIVSELCYQLGEGWSRLANKENPLKEIPVDELLTPPVSPVDMKYESSKPAASDKTGGSVSPNAKSQSATVPSCEDKNNSNSTVKPPAFSTDELSEKHEKDAISDSEGLLMDNGSGCDKPKADTADVKNSDVESESKDSNPVSLNKNCEPVAQAMKTDCAVLKSSEVTENISESTAGTDFSEPKMDTTETVVGETAEVGQDTEPGTSGITELRKMWRPNISRLNVAKRLAPCQYCFIPPSRYVFSEAEVFTIVDTDSESDLDDIDTSCTDRDTTSESAIDTSVNADSSGALIDPTAEEEQKHANDSELIVENVTDGDDKIKQTEEETNDLNLVNTQVNGQVISDVPVDSVISKEPDTGVK